MARHDLIRQVFYVAILLVAVHLFAVTYFLYGFIWWFDIPLHFLGGLWVGLFSLWIFFDDIKKVRVSRSVRVLIVGVVGAFTFGIAWEFFEYFVGITNNTIGNYPLDVIKDLTMDMVGGYVSYLYFIIKGYDL